MSCGPGLRAGRDGVEQGPVNFSLLQAGEDCSRLLITDNANAYFTAQALQDFASSLGPLGQPQAFVPTGEHSRGE